MGSMETRCCRPSPVPDRELWTRIRLLAVLIAFGLWVHWRFGPAVPPCVKGGIVILFFLFCLLGLFSVNLARFLVLLLALPIHAAIILNRMLFDGAYWSFRTILRLFYMRRVSAFIAFLCELGVLVALSQLAELLIRRYCF